MTETAAEAPPETPHVRDRLKALRVRAGYSVRQVAGALKPGSPNYAYYESRKFKKDVLPDQLVRQLEPLFARRGVEISEITALGRAERQASVGFEPPRPGLSESELVEFRSARPHDAKAAQVAATVAALCPDRPNAHAWEIRTDALELGGYRPGDMAVVDLDATEARSGDVVCAQIYDWSAASARTVIRVYAPPYLVPRAMSDRYAIEYVDGERVVIKGIVVASFRLGR